MSDKKVPVSVVITAVDNVTYKVIAINDKIKRITAPISKVGTAFKTLGDEAGIGKLGKALGEAGKTGKEFFSSVGEAIAKIAGVGLAAAGSIYEVVHSFAEAGNEVGVLSRRLGITTDSYQELAFAAKQANVDQETFNGAMGKFSKGIGEAAAGTGEAFIGFNALGISVRDSSGHIRKLDDLLPAVADRLKGIQSQSLRNAIATKIFGKEGAKLNDIFNDGAAGLEKMRKEAHRVGAVMTPEQIKAAREFDDGMNSITATVLSVRNAIGSALAPVLLKFGENLQTYILSHRPEIEAFANAFADKLPGVISQLINVFNGFVTVLTPVWAAFKFLSSIFGEVNVAATGLMAYLAGPAILNMFKFAGALSKVLGPALRVAWIAVTLLGEAFLFIITSLAALVGWPILIGAAFVAAALLVWKYWEPIKEFFSSIGDKLSGFFGGKASIDQTVNSTAAPSLGPAAGFGQTVDASKRSSEKKNMSEVMVKFDNLPEGAVVEKKKEEGLNLDLYLGYQGVGS